METSGTSYFKRSVNSRTLHNDLTQLQLHTDSLINIRNVAMTCRYLYILSEAFLYETIQLGECPSAQQAPNANLEMASPNGIRKLSYLPARPGFYKPDRTTYIPYDQWASARYRTVPNYLVKLLGPGNLDLMKVKASTRHIIIHGRVDVAALKVLLESLKRLNMLT